MTFNGIHTHPFTKPGFYNIFEQPKLKPQHFIFLLAVTLFQTIYAQNKVQSESRDFIVPPLPDYNNEKHWAALPNREDQADRVPRGLKDSQKTAKADVFFIHPTTYTGKAKDSFYWNAPVDWPELNRETDNGTIRYQASVFNGAARVYAPRYRQAHIRTFFQLTGAAKNRVLGVAYSDVRRAFEHYLKNYNNGRPIIIAAHSQGTVHAHRLLKEFFEGHDLQQKLIAVYMPGMPVPSDSLRLIKPCDTAAQCGCWYTWRTFRYGYEPQYWESVCHNPLSWKRDTTYMPKTMNKGAVLTDFKKIRQGLCDAQVNNGILWVHRPKFPGSRLIKNPNYHIGDYNLFYMNIRENVCKQVQNYFASGR
jgi:hypothetical protein